MLQAPDGRESSPTEHLCSADSDRLVTLCIAMVNGPLKNCQTFTYYVIKMWFTQVNTSVKQFIISFHKRID